MIRAGRIVDPVPGMSDMTYCNTSIRRESLALSCHFRARDFTFGTALWVGSTMILSDIEQRLKEDGPVRSLHLSALPGASSPWPPDWEASKVPATRDPSSGYRTNQTNKKFTRAIVLASSTRREPSIAGQTIG